MAVRLLLGRDHSEVRDPHLGQQLLHALQPGTVEWGIYQLQLAHIVARAQGQHRVHEAVQARIADVPDGPCGHGLVEADELHAVEAVRFLDRGQHIVRRLRCDLTAVRSIHLIAVVFGRIVAGRDAYACPAAMIAHRPAQGRGRLQARIDPHRDAVRREHPGGLPGEELSFDAAVIGDGRRLREPAGIEVVREPLGRPAHRIDVHAIFPRADDAAKAAGAERQFPIEPIGHRLLVAAYLAELRDEVGIFSRTFQPTLQLRLMIHDKSLLILNDARCLAHVDYITSGSRFHHLFHQILPGLPVAFLPERYLPALKREVDLLTSR